MTSIQEEISKLSIELLENKQALNSCANSIMVAKAAERDGTWDGGGRWETFDEWEVSARHAAMMLQKKVDETKIALAKAKDEWRRSNDYNKDVRQVLKQAREAIMACEEFLNKSDIR